MRKGGNKVSKKKCRKKIRSNGIFFTKYQKLLLFFLQKQHKALHLLCSNFYKRFGIAAVQKMHKSNLLFQCFSLYFLFFFPFHFYIFFSFLHIFTCFEALPPEFFIFCITNHNLGLFRLELSADDKLIYLRRNILDSM